MKESLSHTICIEEKVRFLKRPEVYPDVTYKVEVKETHMSWVFLTDGFVYKLKKPVAYQFLDFRSLESRFKNCREELQLNKRLAKDIYLELVPLSVGENGKMSIMKKGHIIDWLVKMIRIPEENMLDYAIKNNSVNPHQLKQVAALLIGFYKDSTGIVLSAERHCHKLKDEIKGTYQELCKPEYKLSLAEHKKFEDTLLQYLADHPDIFKKRLREGRVIEAHGDLRPEHVCLAPDPAIIDCLEFNKNLRIMDTAEELSFLAIECEVLGDDFPGKLFFDYYTKATGDGIPASLILFYKLKKAWLRVFLVVRHIGEQAYKNDPKWIHKTNAYLQLARQYQQHLSD